MELETGTVPTTTAQAMIKRAYGILGDIGQGEDLNAAQAATGLEALNAMLDSISIMRNAIYEINQTTHTWPANTTTRTIGSGGDFDTRRPDRIADGTYFKDSNNIAYPCEVVRNRDIYDTIYDKTVTSSYPNLLMYDTSYPLGTLYAWPVPDHALTLYLNQWNPLQIFETLTEALALPPGYRRMIVYNLAVELESEAGLPCPDSARRIAASSLRAVKRNNNIPILSNTDVFYALKGNGKADIVAGR